MVREVVAVVAQQVVLRGREARTNALDHGLDLGVRQIRDALEDRDTKGSARRLEARPVPEDAGLGGRGRVRKGAVRVFTVVEHDACVQEGEAEGPEDGGEAAWREEVVDIDDDFGLGDLRGHTV